MEEFKKSLTEYSDFINQYNGADTIGLLAFGDKVLDDARRCLSASELAQLKMSIDEFYELQLKLKDINTQSLSFKSHLIGFGVYVVVEAVLIL